MTRLPVFFSKKDPEDSVDSERRGFLRGGFLTRDGRKKFKQQEQVGRFGPLPPSLWGQPWQDNPCLGCAQPCVKVCETGIIRIHPRGHAFAGMPYLAFENGGCTFCNECIKQCPLDTRKRPGTRRLGDGVLDRVNCVAWSGRICMTCQLTCTYRAIDMDSNNRPSINNDSCSGCGFCVGVCPVNAISVT
ncbi:MAG: 4Fe-4S dicluster domain-containing protein [Gammaproteobacteria bacterium]|nr:4Fe-4S dicluster domain-containing protein [Gammaproteobacteria bacterium]